MEPIPFLGKVHRKKMSAERFAEHKKKLGKFLRKPGLKSKFTPFTEAPGIVTYKKQQKHTQKRRDSGKRIKKMDVRFLKSRKNSKNNLVVDYNKFKSMESFYNNRNKMSGKCFKYYKLYPWSHRDDLQNKNKDINKNNKKFRNWQSRIKAHYIGKGWRNKTYKTTGDSLKRFREL